MCHATSRILSAALLPLLLASASNRLTTVAVVADGYVPSIEITIHGRHLRADVDTGALYTIIDSQQASVLGLHRLGDLDVHGAGSGSVKATRLEPMPIVVGEQTFVPRDPVALDLSGTGSVVGERALLGFDFFSKYVVEIDYHRATLTLFDPASFTYHGSPDDRVPLVVRPPRIYVEAMVGAQGVAPERHLLRVDTGSSDAVDDDIILRSTGPKKTIVGGVGIGKTFKTTLGTVNYFKLGRHVLHDLPSASGGVQLIGGAVWHRYKVTFDVPNRVMYLQAP